MNDGKPPVDGIVRFENDLEKVIEEKILAHFELGHDQELLDQVYDLIYEHSRELTKALRKIGIY